jgi:hypothetical protein
MSNRNSKGGTAADSSTTEEVTTSSQTIAKPRVSSSLFSGQKVFVKTINYGGGSKDEGLKETKIASVGNKWFTIVDNLHGRFNKETLLHDGKGYSPRYRIYLDEKEYKDEIELSDLSSKIRAAIGQYSNIKLPLEKLRKIWDIMQS